MIRLSEEEYDAGIEGELGICVKCQATKEPVEYDVKGFCPSCEALYTVRSLRWLFDQKLLKIVQSEQQKAWQKLKRLPQPTLDSILKSDPKVEERYKKLVESEGKTKTDEQVEKLRSIWEGPLYCEGGTGKKPKKEIED